MELLHLGKSVAKIIWAGPLNPFKLEPDPFITYWHDGSKLLISTGVRFYNKVLIKGEPTDSQHDKYFYIILDTAQT